MPRGAQSIPNLIQGVSQQPPSLRRNTQAERQENAFNSVSLGQIKRPPSEHRTKISSDDLSSALIHTIYRDENEQYIVVMTDGDLKVYDLDGVEKTVNFPDGKDYLLTGNPKTDLKLTTVQDFTFLVNNSVTTAMTSDLSPTKNEEALIYIALGVANKSYKVQIGGYTAKVKTGSTASSNLDTSDIADVLINGGSISGGSFTGTNLNAIPGTIITRYGNVIHIRYTSGILNIETEDGYAGKAMYAITDKIQRFSELPNDGSPDFTVEVIGDNSSSFDNYYVKLIDNEGSASLWEETVKPDIPWEIDKTTMPHTLISEADGSFTFKAQEWDKRLAGDELSSPEPSFIGSTINDVFFYKDRLGFLSDDNYIFSETSQYFNFFKKTVTTILDTDVIDQKVSSKSVSILENAVLFNNTLLFFSEKTQFKISGDDELAAGKFSALPVTDYENDTNVKPIGLERAIFFSVEKGSYTSIMEYFLQDDSGLETSETSEVTEHASKYIPGQVTKFAGSSIENVMAVLTDQEPNSIYIYQYFWSGQEKLQSSFNKWVFPTDDNILNADFIKNDLVMLVQRSDGVYLDVIDFDIEATDTNVDYKTRYDRRVSDEQCVVSYDAPSNTTTWTLPYEYSGTMEVVTRYSGSSIYPPGFILKTSRGSNSEITATGDYSTTPVYLGIKYKHLHEFSPLNLKDRAPGGGSSSVMEGRLQLQFMTVGYNNSGYFKAVVDLPTGTKYEYPFTGRQIGLPSSTIGNAALATGQFRFPIRANADDVKIYLENDTFLPSVWNAAEWEGNYVSKARRF